MAVGYGAVHNALNSFLQNGLGSSYPIVWPNSKVVDQPPSVKVYLFPDFLPVASSAADLSGRESVPVIYQVTAVARRDASGPKDIDTAVDDLVSLFVRGATVLRHNDEALRVTSVDVGPAVNGDAWTERPVSVNLELIRRYRDGD